MRQIKAAKDSKTPPPSQRELAHMSGISQSRISDLYNEKAGSPSLAEVVALCLALDIRPSSLMEQVEKSMGNGLTDNTDLSPEERGALAIQRANSGDYDLAAFEGDDKDGADTEDW